MRRIPQLLVIIFCAVSGEEIERMNEEKPIYYRTVRSRALTSLSSVCGALGRGRKRMMQVARRLPRRFLRHLMEISCSMASKLADCGCAQTDHRFRCEFLRRHPCSLMYTAPMAGSSGAVPRRLAHLPGTSLPSAKLCGPKALASRETPRAKGTEGHKSYDLSWLL